MAHTPKSASDLIDKLDGSTAVAKLLGLPAATTVASWKDRNSIPVIHWPRLIVAARERGYDVDEALLVKLHVAPPTAPSDQEHAKAGGS